MVISVKTISYPQPLKHALVFRLTLCCAGRMGTIFFYSYEAKKPITLEISALHGTSGDAVQQAILQKLGYKLPVDCSLTVSGRQLPQLVWGEAPLQSGAEIRVQRTYSAVQSQATYRLVAVAGPDTAQEYFLGRGTYTLGKSPETDFCFQDDALADIHGTLLLDDRGVCLVTDDLSKSLGVEEPFILGNTQFLITRQLKESATARTVDLSAVEVELPARRQSWIYLLLVLSPLILGLIIASVTKMWLFLVMSIASSLMMGVHWLMSRGESKKAQRIISAGVELDKVRACSIPSLVELVNGATFQEAKATYLVLGSGSRTAWLKHRNIDDYRVPIVKDIPLVFPLESEQRYCLDLPVHTIRAMLWALVAQHEELILLGSSSNRQINDCFEALSRLEICKRTDVLTEIPEIEHFQGVVVVPSTTWKSMKTVPRISGYYLVIGPSSELSPHDFSALFRAEGHYQERTALYKYPACSDAPHFHCWNNGLSERLLFQAIGRRVALGQARVDVESSTNTRSISAFTLPASQLQELYARDIFAFIGTTEQGYHQAGITADGPHWLIAGTTGSGKSELLRTMLLSIMLRYPPERVAFSLIDFKGGATLGPFAPLPHVSNVLTDLEAHSVERALQYFRADLLAREKEFQNLGISSYADYLALHQSIGKIPAFPELVIVVDEFKMLVDQLPSAMSDLMKVATIGRSLGVHLILATQRPQGAVSQDIRANIAMTICLRVSSAQDSHNVIGSDLASAISTQHPGRGYIARAGEKPLIFQAPLMSGLYDASQPPQIRVRSSSEGHGSQEVKDIPTLENVTNLLLQELKSEKKYVPVPYDLPASTPQQVVGESQFYLGEAEIAELACRGPMLWSSRTMGSLALLSESSHRGPIVAALLEQASQQKLNTVVFAADALSYKHFSRLAQSGKLSAVFNGNDLGYCEYVLDQLTAGKDSSPTFFLIDSLDIWLELCSRNPDFEAKLHFILREGQRFGVSVLATSAQPLRAKTQTAVPNTMWTASVADKDPFKKGAKSFPRVSGQHLVAEGEIVHQQAKTIYPYSVIAAVAIDPESLESTLFPASPVFSQLPRELSADQIEPKPESHLGRAFYLGRKGDHPLVLPLASGKFIPVVGPRGSGKTSLLRSIRCLNPEFGYLYLSGKSNFTHQELDAALDKVKNAHTTVLMIDDLNYLENSLQEKIISAAGQFASCFVAYAPWQRWMSSPILMGLHGCTRGLALMPSPRTLEIFAEAQLPADLKTEGDVFPGRAVLISDFSTTAFQTPFSSK